MKIGTKEFDTANKTYIMGILNVTPDSFSDGGRFLERDRALFRTEKMIEEGADIIDVGGESTRPGYEKVCAEEELERTLPVIKAIREHFDIPLSVDTYKSAVAKEAVLAGADLINDIWGLKADKEMAKIIAGTGAACCLMHNREKPDYKDFIKELKEDLKNTVHAAQMAGIQKEKIILDPGVGFAKSVRDNLQAIRSLEQLKELGYPILLGASRKSLIGLTLNLPVHKRLEGTIVTTVFAVLKGANFVRVHDIKENARAVRMAEAILES